MGPFVYGRVSIKRVVDQEVSAFPPRSRYRMIAVGSGCVDLHRGPLRACPASHEPLRLVANRGVGVLAVANPKHTQLGVWGCISSV